MLKYLYFKKCSMTEVIELKNDSLTARINADNWQLFSLELDETEFMWGGGKPEELKTEEEKQGWPNSGIVMFPIVGRADDDRITIDGTQYPMTQHGVSRHLPSTLVQRSDKRVGLLQLYQADTDIKTPKITCVFPFDFSLYREFILRDGFLTFRVNIVNECARDFPYAVGWHPAFRVPLGDSYIEYIYYQCIGKGLRKHFIGEIKEESKTGALVLPHINEVKYVSGIGRVTVSSDFGHMQIWSPEGQNLICLEPITALSLTGNYHGDELQKRTGYRMLKPHGSATFLAYVKPDLVKAK